MSGGLSIDLKEMLDDLDFQEFRRYKLDHVFNTDICAISLAFRYSIVVITFQRKWEEIDDLNNDDIIHNENVLLEFPTTSGVIISTIWLPNNILLLGFEYGNFMAFSADGLCLLETKYFDSCIESIRYRIISESVYEVWLLYDSGYIVMLSIESSNNFIIQNVYKYKLLDHQSMNDFSISPLAYKATDLLNPLSDDNVLTVFVVGLNSSISLYNFGCNQHFEHFGKLANYVKEKVTNVISKTFSSIVESIKPSSTTKLLNKLEYDKAVSSVMDIKDASRRILRIYPDPSGRYLGLVDVLGRALLFDIKINTIIRIWKGVRDAQISWNESECYDNEHKKYHIAIYAPLVGLLYFYELRHGPLVKCIPVGNQCQIFCDTLKIVNSKSNLMKCFVTKFKEGMMTIQAVDLDHEVRDSTSTQVEAIPFESISSMSVKSNLVDELNSVDALNSTDLCSSANSEMAISFQNIQGVLQSLNSMRNVDSSTISLSEINSELIFFVQNNSCLTLNNFTDMVYSIESIELQLNLCFSVELHGLIYRSILEVISEKDSYLVREVKLRQCHLDAFAILSNLMQTDNSDNQNTSNDIETYLSMALELSKQNTRRSEALSWLLQDLRNNLLRSSKDATESLFVSFSSFRILVIDFHIFDLKSNDPDQHALKTITLSHMLNKEIYFKWIPTSDIVNCITNLLIRPLLTDDPFILPSLTQTYKLLKWSNIDVLTYVTPLTFSYAFNASSECLIKLLVSSQTFSSVLKRLIRDCLFDIQDTVNIILSTASDDASFDVYADIEDIILSLNNMDKNSFEALDSHKQYEIIRLMNHLKSSDVYSGTKLSESKLSTTAAVSGSNVNPTTSFDKIINFLLTFTVDLVMNSSNTVAAMSVVTIVLETFVTISDQLERRTFAAFSLQNVINDWIKLFCKLRIVEVLRNYDYRYNVNINPTAKFNVYTVNNVNKCNVNVFKFLSFDTLNFVNDGEEAVQHELRCLTIFLKKEITEEIYHKNAMPDSSIKIQINYDSKWRDLLSIVYNDLGVESSQTQVKKKQKPLLLYFPFHNRSINLSCHRVLVLAETWSQSPQNLKHVKRLLSHLSKISSEFNTLRQLLAVEVMNAVLVPLIITTQTIESDPNTVINFKTEIIDFLLGSGHFDEFVKYCLDLLTCIENIFEIPADEVNLSIEKLIEAMNISEFESLDGSDIWPPVKDHLMTSILLKYHSNLLSINLRKYSNVIDGSNLTKTSNGIDKYNKIFTETKAFLLVMQLKSSYGLRSFKYTSMLNNVNNEEQILSVSDDKSPNVLLNRRIDFIKQCFKHQLSTHNVSITQLAVDCWQFHPDSVHILQLSVLIDLGNSDHLIENIACKISDKYSVVECLLFGIRSRMGTSLIRMDRISKYGSLMSSLDPDILSWVRGGNLDASALEIMIQDNDNVVNFNVSSTRQLVLICQSIIYSNQSNDNTWLDKRIKCDALLELCDAMLRANY